MVNENSLKNLEKGMDTRFQSGEQAAIAGKKGGIARQRKRRERMALQENVKTILETRPAMTPELKKTYTKLGLKGTNYDIQSMILAGLANKAIGGNCNCSKLLFELLGETWDAQLKQLQIIQEKQKVGLDEIEGAGSETFDVRRALDEMTDEELEAYERFCSVFGMQAQAAGDGGRYE